MPNGIIIGIVIGLCLGWRIHAWWTKSSIKKATDVVGSATQKPGQLAKGLVQRGRDLFGKFFGNKDDKEKL